MTLALGLCLTTHGIQDTKNSDIENKQTAASTLYNAVFLDHQKVNQVSIGTCGEHVLTLDQFTIIRAYKVGLGFSAAMILDVVSIKHWCWQLITGWTLGLFVNLYKYHTTPKDIRDYYSALNQDTRGNIGTNHLTKIIPCDRRLLTYAAQGNTPIMITQDVQFAHPLDTMIP